MSSPANLARQDGATIAYHRLTGSSPGVVFLGGFHSDMVVVTLVKDGDHRLSCEADLERLGRTLDDLLGTVR